MEYTLKNIGPQDVFHYFEELTRIPRDSGKEEEVANYLVNFAKENGFQYHKDKLHNVLIIKEATAGYEDRPTIILQGHTDMVCEKNTDTIHDFDKDPIKLVVDGDKVSADGTTLGADNGIGIALALALLADKTAEHPRIELVCTSDEERGMAGVEAFDTDLIQGRTLINLDGSEEGVFIVGCAGGPGVLIEIPVKTNELVPEWKAARISIRGLKGGHSGEDIHRGRANSIKLISRILSAIEKETRFQLCDINGGLKYNAIPREADALIYIPKESVDVTRAVIDKMQGIFRDEYITGEKNLAITMTLLTEGSGDLKVAPLAFSDTTRDAIMNYTSLAETGIIRMSPEFANVVESSVSMGVITTAEDKVLIETLTRSSVKSVYMDMYYKIERLAKLVGANTSLMSNCPEWEYNRNSRIKKVFEETYYEMYNKQPGIQILHAGLECGVFAEKIEDQVDMIALGPDIRDMHTPGEYVSISSTARFWEFFKEAIKRL